MSDFNEYDMSTNLNEIVRFLEAVHPSLADIKGKGVCVELRPVKRAEAKFVNSCVLWKLDSKGQDYLQAFLKTASGLPYCIFYSLWTYDKSRQTDTQKASRRIHNHNALFTQVLPMDFDDIERGEYEKYYQKLEGLGIDVTTVYTGYGYQALIHLDKPCNDASIFAKFTRLLVSRGFPVDENITDSARLFRVPGTFNCKVFSERDKRYNPGADPKHAKIVTLSQKRYALGQVIEAISQLPVVEGGIGADRDEGPSAVEHASAPVRPYSLDLSRLPKAVQRMLNEGARQGLRHKTLVFLVSYLKRSVGLGYGEIQEAMGCWAQRCSPPFREIRAEVSRILSYGYSANGMYTSELAKTYGFIDFGKRSTGDMVLINKGVFEHFTKKTSGALRLWLYLKFVEPQQLVWTIEDLVTKYGVSEKTLRTHLRILCKLKLVDKTRGCKKSGEAYTYRLCSFYQSSSGFVRMHRALLGEYLRGHISSNELLVLMYMRYKSSDGICACSQYTLGRSLGMTPHGIQQIIQRLAQKGIITVLVSTSGSVARHTYKLAT